MTEKLEPKFIICDGEVICGHVEFHRELIPKKAVEPVVLGGGWWYFHNPTNTLYLYGTSTQFNHVTQKQLDEAFFPQRDNGVTIVFDPFMPRFEYLQKKYNLYLNVSDNTNEAK
jgi:hypothetical protein